MEDSKGECKTNEQRNQKLNEKQVKQICSRWQPAPMSALPQLTCGGNTGRAQMEPISFPNMSNKLRQTTAIIMTTSQMEVKCEEKYDVIAVMTKTDQDRLRRILQFENRVNSKKVFLICVVLLLFLFGLC